MRRLLCVTLLCCGSLVAQNGDPAQRRGGGMRNGGQSISGTVTAISDAAIFVKGDDGSAYTVDLTANTRLMKDRQPVRSADLKNGDTVMAVGILEPGKKELHALIVMVMTPEQAKQIKAREIEMRANLGKTYIAGRVTKIDEAKISVERFDGVNQTIVADENTSIRRGTGRGMGGIESGMTMQGGGSAMDAPPPGESITLTDVKVGETIAGRGALKAGVFVPTMLMVTEGRKPRPDGASAAPPQ